MKALTVSQLTGYIKKLICSDPILSKVSVKGEISNFKHHYSGHMYFTLKDDNAKLKCVMFRSSSMSLKFQPEDGMNVIVTGNVSLYERDGQYQLYADDMQPDGLGALYLAYEQLKKKLEDEGLFDDSHKVAIPKYPSKVGVVTSSTGAAVKDIINIISRRAPGVDILIVPVLVQGEGAAEEIASAIELLNRRKDIDVIIIGRGGGSIEELWAFNEEIVARAIYNSSIPIISAVGHETDFTIADFAADLRAPTPSAAAELCVPDRKDMEYKLKVCYNSLCSMALYNIKNTRAELEQQTKLLKSLNPQFQVNQRRQYIDSLYQKLAYLIKYEIDMKRESLKKYGTSLELINPLAVISRGYSITYLSGTEVIVDNIDRVKNGDNIDVQVKNGRILCRVEDVMEGDMQCEKGRKQ